MQALKPKKRGRRTGEKRTLTPTQEKEILSLIVDTLCLPLMDEFTLRLCHVGKNLKHQIGNERAGQIVVLFSRVQQRKIHDVDVCTLHLRYNPPLVKDFIIVAAEPVNAFHHKQIACTQFFHEVMKHTVGNYGIDDYNAELHLK